MARILVIDDNCYMRQVLATCLPGLGHSVVVANDGEAGLKLANEASTDLIMVDFDMPKMNGISVCEALKRDPMRRHIPVLMMTGRNKDEILLRAKKAGARTVLGKPFSWDTLVAEFRRHLPLGG